MTATIIAVLNRKGGVTKTTTAEALAYYLHCVLNKRVLLVDADGQANLTTGQGYDWKELERDGNTLGDVLLGDRQAREVIQERDEWPHLLPSSNKLDEQVEPELIRREIPPTNLRGVLEEVRDHYDYILIDGPPSLSLITKNAMAAADVMVVPVSTDPRSMEGLDLFFDTYFKIRDEHNPHSEVLCVLPTRFNRWSLTQRQSLDFLRKLVPGDVPIAPPVRYSNWFDRASAQRKTIGQIAHLSPGAQAYKRLAEQIIENYG